MTSSAPFSPPLFSASSCSRKKGFPSAASTMRRRSSAARSRSGLRRSASVTDSSSARGVNTARTAFARGADHAGRSSSSSGRVRHKMTIRAPLEKLATYSSRSSSVSSAQWMSSTTRTSGRSRASASKSRRNAQDVSSPEPLTGSAPNAPATPSAIASRRSSSATSSRTAARASAPRTGRRASASGRKVMPSPYGAQRPINTRTESPSSARNSRASRDFPTPAAPTTVARTHSAFTVARRRAPCKMPRSWRRPTSGTSSRRSKGDTFGSTRTSRNAGTGSAFPLRTSGSNSSTSIASPPRTRVRAPIRISPAAADCSSRAAMFVVSLETVSPSAPSPDTSTSPVETPVRTPSRIPRFRSKSSFRSSRRCRISAAARSARRASSSRAVGTPKTATTASPMNFSTLPPWRSTTSRTSSK